MVRIMTRESQRPKFFLEEYESYYYSRSPSSSPIKKIETISSKVSKPNSTRVSKPTKPRSTSRRIRDQNKRLNVGKSKPKAARKLDFINVPLPLPQAVAPAIAAPAPAPVIAAPALGGGGIFGALAPAPVIAAPVFGGGIFGAPVLGDFEPIPAELMDTSMWESSKNPEEGIFRYESKLLENSPEANVEICFSFDTTGSMSMFVDEVKEKMEDIVKYLTADIPNIRISIIAHGDYCDYKKYVLKRIDLSNDPVAISNFIKSAEETFGGDKEECIELVLKEAQNLSWSPSSSKVLVLISDSIPHHNKEYFEIDWKNELNTLKIMGVKVYGVSCGKSNQEFFQEISKETGGSALELNRFVEISELISGLAYREAANLHALENENDLMNKDENFTGRLVRMPSKSNERCLESNAVKGKENENENEKKELDSGECFKIHEAIHNGNKFVEIKGEKYDIAIGKAGCKFVRIGEQTFIQQNKDKNTKYARMAIEGRKITWIIQRGNWGLIMGERQQEIEINEAKNQSGHA